MSELINEGNAKKVMFLAMAIFGTIGTITHFIDMPSSVIVVFRGFIGAGTILILVYAMGRSISAESIMGNLFTLICSGICLGLNWLFLFEAYKSIEVSLATVCNYLTPALVILVSPIFLHEKMTPTKLGCALIALFGLVLVSGLLESGMSGANSYGVACGVLAAVFYTGLIIFNKKLKSIGAFDKTFVQLAIAAIIVMVYCVFTIDFGSLSFETKDVMLMVLLGVVQTGIAFTLYFGSITMMDTQSVAIYGYVEPILGIFLSVAILSEDLGPIGWLGAALILGSTMVPELMKAWKHRKMVEG